MLADGIEEICHPLMAPALFVHKKSGDIQLCIDYRELNKRTVKIAYLLPCPDEVHDQIVGVLYFLHSTCRKAGYCISQSSSSQGKDSILTHSGLGISQFRSMPLFAGALSLDEQGLSWLLFVTVNCDDIRIHSIISLQ